MLIRKMSYIFIILLGKISITIVDLISMPMTSLRDAASVAEIDSECDPSF